jgi:hypothetical protein
MKDEKLQTPIQAHVNGHGFAPFLNEHVALRLHRTSHEEEPWGHGDASHPIPLAPLPPMEPDEAERLRTAAEALLAAWKEYRISGATSGEDDLFRDLAVALTEPERRNVAAQIIERRNQGRE